MNKHLRTALLGLIVAALWGYFADLQNGHIGWFIGRLVFVPLVVVTVQWLFAKGTSPG